jgi:hypothetical protein
VVPQACPGTHWHAQQRADHASCPGGSCRLAQARSATLTAPGVALSCLQPVVQVPPGSKLPPGFTQQPPGKKVPPSSQAPKVNVTQQPPGKQVPPGSKAPTVNSTQLPPGKQGTPDSPEPKGNFTGRPPFKQQVGVQSPRRALARAGMPSSALIMRHAPEGPAALPKRARPPSQHLASRCRACSRRCRWWVARRTPPPAP